MRFGYDAEAARTAQLMQAFVPGWMVLWSLRYRRFEGWKRSAPGQGHMVHASNAARLWDFMEQQPELHQIDANQSYLPLLFEEKEAVVIPSHAPPAGEQLNAATWCFGAIEALERLRIELQAYWIRSEISYAEGQHRLVLEEGLTVWADDAGTVFCWGGASREEPADHAPVHTLPEAARRIAERLGWAPDAAGAAAD